MGVIFYQFAKNDEVFSVTSETIYINYGETLSLDDIGFSRKEESKDTKINFNAGGDEVTSIIKFDDVKRCYVPTNKGGSTTIVISTTNSKYKKLSIDVVVGVGTEENPYYISNEKQLFNIGDKFELSKHYFLIKDINLVNTHSPIGHKDGDEYEFSGTFDGNYHTISNFKIAKNVKNAGLFGILGQNGSISNLTVKDSTISGSFHRAGALVGLNNGTLNRINVVNANIKNTYSLGATGGIAGASQKAQYSATTPSIMRSSVTTDNNSSIKSAGVVGGLVGITNATVIHACYTGILVENNGNNFVGGFVGQFTATNDSYIRECYSISKVTGNASLSGNFIGCLDIDSSVSASTLNKRVTLIGNYYTNKYNSLPSVSADENNLASATSYTISGKSDSELKQKNTYIYYIDSNNIAHYWDSLWYIEDGQYPVISSENHTPDNINPSNPEPVNPSDSVIISNKSDVQRYLQGSTSISGTYILTNDIDLGGMIWTPVKFSGIFKSINNDSYTISNFKISSTSKNIGFFSVMGNSTIKSINFKDVTISNNATNSCVGVLAGIVQGSTTITDVQIINPSISTKADYVGGLVGYTSSSIISIKDCKVYKASISGQNSNASGFVAYTGANTVVSNCRTFATVYGVNKVGGFCAINYGTIDDCIFEGKVYSVGDSSQGLFGGFVGVNHSIISNNKSILDEMVVENLNSPSKNVSYIVGGVVGYNRAGSVTKSNVIGGKILTANSISRVYIGGICGYNSKTLKYNFSSLREIGSVNSVDCVAGISAYNYGGNIEGCYTHTDKLAGLIVAGLVLSNSNNATISSCYTGKDMFNRTVFTGKNLAGIVYDLINGTINDSLVSAELKGNNSSSTTAGFAMFMPYVDKKFGTISKCISNVSFTGEGYKYLITSQDGLLNKNQCTGSVINSVISSDASVSGVIIPQPSKLTIFIWDIRTYKAGSNSSFKTASTKELRSIELYLSAEVGYFDINSSETDDSIWIYFNNSRLPMPRKIFEASLNTAG